MKKVIIGMVILVLCLGGYVFALNSSGKITNRNQFDRTLEYYFYKKDSAQLAQIVNYLNSSNYLDIKYTKAPVQGFFMGILHENPATFNSIEKMQLSSSLKTTLNDAKEFSPYIESVLNNKPDYGVESAAFLDMLWGYYLATGDNRVLNKMCEIQKTNPDPVIKGAAKWSYESNKQKHPGKIKSYQ